MLTELEEGYRVSLEYIHCTQILVLAVGDERSDVGAVPVLGYPATGPCESVFLLAVITGLLGRASPCLHVCSSTQAALDGHE